MQQLSKAKINSNMVSYFNKHTYSPIHPLLLHFHKKIIQTVIIEEKFILKNIEA